VFLKVIKLADGRVMPVCLVLNHALPEHIVLKKESREVHSLKPDEMPLASQGKQMPANAGMLTSGENPYDALIRHLNLKEAVK